MSTQPSDLNPEDRLPPHNAEHYPPHPNGTTIESGDWPDPEPLPDGSPAVEPYSPELMPSGFRAAVDDIAERMQVPPDLPAATYIVALAASVGRRAVIRPKAHDDARKVTPNIYGGIVTRPGYMKSPVIAEATAPLRAIEATLREEHVENERLHRTATEHYGLSLKQWRTAAAKPGATVDDPPEPPVEPICRRVLVNDSTPEKLHAILADNPGGILVLRDELTGLLALLDREERAGERQFYLEVWNGNTALAVDRIGRGSIYVPAACVSLCGGIQPARLRSYISGASGNSPSNDGLMQRLQVLVWPDEPTEDWRRIDRAPNYGARESVSTVIERLFGLPVDKPLIFRFDADAQELFNEWWGQLERELGDGGLPDCLTSHLAKYRSLMPTLAGLYELAEWAQGNGDNEYIGLVNAQRAAATCSYLRSHAVRVYACAPQAKLQAARSLLRHIREGRLGPGSFSLRDAYRPQWSGLATKGEAKAACQTLVEYGWIRPVTPEPGVPGRRSEQYEIHPAAVAS